MCRWLHAGTAEMVAESGSTFASWVYSFYFEFVKEKDKNIIGQEHNSQA